MHRLLSLPRILRNVIANCTGSVVSTLVFFFLTPLLIRQLGAELYAIWVLVHSAGFYLGFLDLGMQSALVKYAAEASTREDAPARLERLVGTTAVIFAGAGACALALCAAAALWLVPLLELPAQRLGVVRWAVLLLGLDMCARLCGMLPGALLEGEQRYGALNRASIALLLGRAAVSVALLAAGAGLLALLAAEVGASLLALAWRAAYVRRTLPGFSFSLARFDLATWREIRSYGLWTLLSNAALRGSADLDKLFIPALFSLALITPYTVAVAIGAAAYRAIAPCAAVLFPLSSALGARGDQRALGELLIGSSKMALALATPFAIFALLAGEPLITLWAGAEHAGGALPLLPWALAGGWLSALIVPAGTIAMALGRTREMCYLGLLEAGLAALLMFASARRWGLVGVAVSCLAASALAEVCGVLPLALRSTGVGVRRYLREVLWASLLPALPVLVLAQLGARLWQPSDWLELALTGAAVLLGYALAFACLSVTQRERSELLGWAHRFAAGKVAADGAGS